MLFLAHLPVEQHRWNHRVAPHAVLLGRGRGRGEPQTRSAHLLGLMGGIWEQSLPHKTSQPVGNCSPYIFLIIFYVH